MVPMLLKYSSKIVNEKVTGNNSTGVMKVRLWGNNIKEVPEKRKYILECVIVREWPADVLNLATTPRTKVTP